MRKQFLICLLFLMNCTFHFAISQNGYNVLYKSTISEFGLGLGTQEVFTRLVFNNYFAYTYSFSQGTKDPMENKTNYGSKPAQHSTLIRRSSADRFYYYGLKGYKFYWAIDTTPLKSPVWVFSSEKQNILGYTCKKAYWLNEYLIPLKDSIKTWRVDTTVVWYTSQINPGYAFFNYPGLPGLPLVISDINKRWQYKAIWISKETIFIEEPKNIMSLEKLRKLHK